ncbi:tetratricopeptide repeat protein [Sphingomonas sp. MAH-20]|uniref:Tetratricopeptide repeat protein n=1 Tax=Sphingomonas horti TaxID=2682842 RepID=A0A6I4IZ22_9SPHN|nr:aspartyl/asparaginyl beta-hydroxylase domain-containing protein [Sphingomonas sp. CGMCC 1.13658]MBA2918502.1 aspartyl/asparaginyl beta-hydroxylase domain-containing protein [Sphingomonas sp. CGMCC 1.13658]MVO77469.1 tetratricopeptide repeat protein [Sphingomonas horti]
MNDPRIAQLLSAAAAEQRAQRPQAAVRYLEQVVAIAPDHPQALNSLGTQALARSDFAAARNYFARAAAADPGEPVLWLNLARACRELGDDDGELAALDRVLAIDARAFVALLRKAHLFQRTGQNARAALHWGQAGAVAPPDEQLSPEIRAMLDEGRAFAVAHNARFGGVIDGAMGDALAAASPRDRRRVGAAIDAMLGRRQVYANVCEGMTFPFLPADEFFDREHFPWMSELEAAAPAIRAELKDLLDKGDEGFAPYVQYPSGYPESKWSELDHSERWSAYFLWRHGKRIDDHCARCPQTAAAVEKLPLADHAGRAPTVFFSLLHPRTRIPPHTGVTNARTIVHLGLIVPEKCGFRVGGETREWQEGQAFAFDDTIEHEAWNDSDELRAVLILDVWNPHITQTERDLVNRFFQAADASGMNVIIDD